MARDGHVAFHFKSTPHHLHYNHNKGVVGRRAEGNGDCYIWRAQVWHGTSLLARKRNRSGCRYHEWPYPINANSFSIISAPYGNDAWYSCDSWHNDYDGNEYKCQHKRASDFNRQPLAGCILSFTGHLHRRNRWNRCRMCSRRSGDWSPRRILPLPAQREARQLRGQRASPAS